MFLNFGLLIITSKLSGFFDQKFEDKTGFKLDLLNFTLSFMKLKSQCWGGCHICAEMNFTLEIRFKNAKGNFFIKGIENALQDKTIDIRIFGKPETKPYRRMGVILANNLKKAKEALSKIKVVNV